VLNIKIPKRKYNTADYANLEEQADGAPIPIPYGDLHGVIPTCINTVDQIYKLGDIPIHAIDQIRSGAAEEILNPAEDYETDLPNAQFTLKSTPLLAAATTYWLVIEVDYAASAGAHIHFINLNNPYADGKAYVIDNAGTWDDEPAYDLWFKLLGRLTLDGPEIEIVDNRGSTYNRFGIRDTALPCAHYRLAQSFLTGGVPIYATRLELKYDHLGTNWPGGHIRVGILSTPGPPYGGAEVPFGSKTEWITISTQQSSVVGNLLFPLVDESIKLACDIEGAEKAAATIKDGADMIEHLVVDQASKSASLLDPVELANFKAKRTQEIAKNIDCDDACIGDIIEKLEVSLLFKFVRLHDGTYATIVYEAGEPANTPHLKDAHFKSFSMTRRFSDIKSIVQVKYDEDPAENKFKVAEAKSNVARFVYGIEETLDVETYLKSAGDAATLAADYLGMYETPPLEITFEVQGYGLDLVPGRDKVKITRSRAAYAGGTLNAVLFRIIKITKKPETARTEIVAILDTQTY
jgi:hypothetical protein